MKYTLPALALAISATLGGCATHHSAAVAQPVVNSRIKGLRIQLVNRPALHIFKAFGAGDVQRIALRA
jgi:hypothetical protein